MEAVTPTPQTTAEAGAKQQTIKKDEPKTQKRVDGIDLLPGTNIDMMQGYIEEKGQTLSDELVGSLEDNYYKACFSLKGNEQKQVAKIKPDSNGNIAFYITSDTSDQMEIQLLNGERIVSTSYLKPRKTRTYTQAGLETGKEYEVLIRLQGTDNIEASGELLLY